MKKTCLLEIKTGKIKSKESNEIKIGK